jgi:hypothetical protein
MKSHFQQKMPINLDRSNVTPSYLHALRVMTLKATVIRRGKKPWTA